MNQKNIVVLIMLTILAGLVRLLYIGFQGPHVDETFVMIFSSPDFTTIDIIVRSLTVEANPPLYFIVAHYAMIIFHGVISDLVAIRLPSAIFGILMIPASYFLATKMYSGLNGKDRFGLIAASIVCLMSNLIFYSDFGRAYSMVTLTSCICFYYFLCLHKDGITHRNLALFGFFGVVSVYTHLYAAMPFVIMSLAVLRTIWVENYKIAIKFLLVVSGCFIPLLSYIPYILSSRTIVISSYGYSVIDILIETPMELFSFAFPIIIPAIALQLICRKDKTQVVIAIGFVVSFFIGLCISGKTAIIPHYFIPFAVPLTIIGLEYLYEQLYRKYKYVAMILILSVVAANVQQVIMLFTVIRM